MAIYDLVDKTNYTAFKFNEQNKGIIDKICEPLFSKFGIEGFSYYTVKSNGSHGFGINVSNQISANEILCNYLSKKGPLFPEEFKKQFWEGKHYFLWSTQGPYAKYNFPLASGLNIYKKCKDHYEIFAFQMLKAAPGLENLFLDNVVFLEMFGKYFKIEAKELIEANKPEKLFFIRDLDLSSPDSLEENKIQQFLETIKPARFAINTRFGSEVLLTERETECMIILCTGKQHYKEIAQELKITDRTVESYIRRIRDKTGYHRISDLIKAFDESFKEWSHLRLKYAP